MPLLGTFVDTAVHFTGVAIRDDRMLDFWSIDGTRTLQWDSTGARIGGLPPQFIATGAATGLEIGPREIIADTVQGLPGQRLREIRQSPRTVVLPVAVVSNDFNTTSHLAQLAKVRQFFNYHAVDYVTAEGTFDLVATSTTSGGQVQRRLLRCVYVSGGEGELGWSQGIGGPFFSFIALQLTAMQPYWRGETWSTPPISVAPSEPFLSDSPADGWPRMLVASTSLGANLKVTVGGDVPSPPVIDIIGPAGIGTAISAPSGLDIELTTAVSLGQTLHIDTGSFASGRRKTVTLDDGSGPQPAWNLVGGSPVWEPLPPGDTVISVEIVGATGATQAVVSGTSLWETAW